jgi:cytidylate kinase
MSPVRNGKESVRERVVICVCGLAGSGKSTQARKIARRYGFEYCSGGDALKALAIEEGYKPLKRGWWEKPEGLRFLKERKMDSEFDRRVDGKLLELAERGDVVLDSWTMPWLFEGGFKVWLEASLDKRAERIARRDRMGVDEALKALERKERETAGIYRRLYGFCLDVDFGPFDLVLDTDCLDADEVFEVLCAVLDNVVFRGKTKLRRV